MGGADTDGAWHHMAYVKKTNKNESHKAITAIFLDGVPIASSPGCDLDCWAAGGKGLIDWRAATIDDVVEIDAAFVGADDVGGRSQDGLIDEFAIWNEALPVGRIKALSNGDPVLSLGDLANGRAGGALVPEPSSIVLVGLAAVCGLLGLRRR